MKKLKMHRTVFLVIFIFVIVKNVECQEKYEIYPCFGNDRVLSTFYTSDPTAFNVSFLLTKYDLLPGRVRFNFTMKFDATMKVTYNFEPITFFSTGLICGGHILLESPKDLIFRVAPFKNKVPNLLSVKVNDVEICTHGIQKDIWTNYVQLGTTTTTAKPIVVEDLGYDECGKRPQEHSPYITRGYKAKPGDWPWHSAIYRLRTKNSQLTYTCGGTLISRTRVITAGHCVVEHGSVISPERLIVAFGKHNFIGNDRGLQEKSVFEVVLHPRYSHMNLSNDIAILKLSSEVTLTDYVYPACLKKAGYPDKSAIVDQLGYVVGWGRDEHGNHSDQLNEARLPIRSDIQCFRKDAAFFSAFLNDGNFCVGYDNGTNVCNGDSGGGLFMPQNTTRSQNLWFLRGIVSLGSKLHDKPICDPNHYTIFTDIAHYIDFIKNNL